MAEQSIDDLSHKEYKARKTRGFEGQKAALKLVDADDFLDMARLRDIDQAKGDDFADDPAPDHELIEWAKDKSKDIEGLLFAVAGGEEHKNKDERGELQGWVYFYPDDADRVKSLRKEGKIDAVERGSQVYEVSYAKHPGAEPGQMASALRQACTEIASMDAALHHQKEDRERADFENSLAERRNQGMTMDEEIAERKSFEDRMSSKYNAPRRIITAYVNKGNDSSVNMLKASGFDLKGPTDYYDEQWDLYVLNWEKLNELMHKAADAALMDKLARLSGQTSS